MSLSYPPLLSHFQARELLSARAEGRASLRVSLDLNLTKTEVPISEAGVSLPEGSLLPWEAVRRVAGDEKKAYSVSGSEARPVTTFSEETGWVRTLYPTEGAPTVLVSGFPMHRIRGIEPWKDTEAKVAALGGVSGRVLDTATGLGYTAILASRAAREVVTIELDPAALEIARLNPWSKGLFESKKIRQVVGDAFEELDRMAEGGFQGAIHDPPTPQFAGDLYSEAMYARLYRVLGRGGRLFHYCGDPASTHGRKTTEGAIRRLSGVGFRGLERHPEAFGVVVKRP